MNVEQWGDEMNRVQVLIAVGLFLVLAIFGWRTYLEKASHRDRSDSRGLPAKFMNDVKAFKASNKDSTTKKTDKQPTVTPTNKADRAEPAAPKVAPAAQKQE